MFTHFKKGGDSHALRWLCNGIMVLELGCFTFCLFVSFDHFRIDVIDKFQCVISKLCFYSTNIILSGRAWLATEP